MDTDGSVAGGVHRMQCTSELQKYSIPKGIRQWEFSKMRFSLAVAVAVVGISMSGLAQQSNSQFRVKHVPADKGIKKSTMPAVKTTGSASSGNSKDLQTLEHQTAKGAGSRTQGARKAPALKPVKEKANPPMNFNGGAGGKGTTFARQSSNPYKGRLKQKHSR
jgi:hypothetical protein